MEERQRDEADCHQDATSDQHRAAHGRGARKGAVVARVQRPQDRGLAAHHRSSREHQHAQRRCDRQCDNHRSQHRERVGQRERLEERTGPPLHDCDRHDREQRDERGICGGLRTSAKASSTMSAVDLAPGLTMLAWRRATLWTPTTASSMMSGIATARPAKAIGLNVSPRR